MKHPCIKAYTPTGNRRFNASFKYIKQGELMTFMDEPPACRQAGVTVKKQIKKTHEIKN